MDLDAFVATHASEWARLEALVKRPRALRGAQIDELVELYQSTATHLSVVQSTSQDSALIARLSSLVARGRSAVAGVRQPVWREALDLLLVDFPAVVYRTRWWWIGAMVGSILVAVALGAYVDSHPAVLAQLVDPEQADQLVNHDFADYYKQAAPQDFAGKVFTNNAQIAAACVLFGIFLGLPVLYILVNNAVNVGVVGGLMADRGRLDLFFGLILPHGILELTAVFVAAGLGLKLGWTVVDPGRRTRSVALAQEGRALVTGAIGLAVTLFVSGLIEGFVTPSGLPTWARIGIGVVAEVLFLSWTLILGRRAVLRGRTGDVEVPLREDLAPTA